MSEEILIDLGAASAETKAVVCGPNCEGVEVYGWQFETC